jgi:hypothetical protein
MKAKEIPAHMRNACETRIVGCRLGGCLKRLPLKDREKHETFECKYRLALCPMGCGLRLVSFKLQRHQEGACDMRQVDCPLGCGMVLRQVVLSSHMESECPKRAVNYGGGGKWGLSRGASGSSVTDSPSGFKKKEMAAAAAGAMRDGRSLSPPPGMKRSASAAGNQALDRHTLPPI